MAKLTNSTIYGSANITGNVVSTGQVFDISANSGINISQANTITGVVITVIGAGYQSVPSVLFSNTTTGGVTANANAVMRISTAAVIGNVGVGYANGDVLYANNVNGLSNAFFTVTDNTATTFGTGGIKTLTVNNAGLFFTVPNYYNTGNVLNTGAPAYLQITGTTSLTGNGANVNISASGFLVNNLYFSNYGSGYVEPPTITFSGGSPTSAAVAYPLVGVNSKIQNLSSTLDFYGANNVNILRLFSNNTTSFATNGNIPALSIMPPQNNYGATTLAASSGLQFISGASGSSIIAFLTGASSPTITGTNFGVQQFAISHISSAVNYLNVTGNTTTNGPTLSAQGSDANIDINIVTKGSGNTNIQSANGIVIKTVDRGGAQDSPFVFRAGLAGTQGGGLTLPVTPTLQTPDGSGMYFATNAGSTGSIGGNRQFLINHIASAVNYLQVAGNTTSNAPTISSIGSDTNISMNFVPKGTGNVNLIAANTVVSGNLYANAGITFADGTRQTTAGSSTANTIYLQGGLDAVNARITIVEGVDATQNTNISNKLNLTGSLNQTVSGNVTIGQDLIVSGNLIITGNVNSQNVQQLAVADPLIVLGVGNYISDAKDIGFAAHYNDGVNAHAGIIRDSGTKEFYVFKGYTPEVDAVNNIDINDASFSKANLNAGYVKSNLIATTAVVNGIDLSSYSSSAYAQANVTVGVDTTQNTRLTVIEGTDVTQNTRLTVIESTDVSQNVRLDYSNAVVTIIQGVDLTQNTNISSTDGKMQSAYNQANVTSGGLNSANANIISLQVLANTDYTTLTATAGVYGNTTYVPVITLAANGRITSIVNTAITGTGGITASGYLANSVIFANTTGYLSNTNGISFYNANNTLVVANISIPTIYTTLSGIVFPDGTTQSTAASGAATDASARANTVYTQGVDVTQNSRMTIIENTDSSQNVRLDYSNSAITIIQGVDTTQNTRLTVIENTDLSQNVRLDYSNTAIAIIQGTDTSQNARMTIIEGVDVSQNANTILLQGAMASANANVVVLFGIEASQNTSMAATDGKMSSAYNQANTGTVLAQAAFDKANTGASAVLYTANSIIFANASGYLSNSNVYFTASNNTLATSNVYVSNRFGFANANNILVVYQVYNANTNSLDTIFG